MEDTPPLCYLGNELWHRDLVNAAMSTSMRTLNKIRGFKQPDQPSPIQYHTNFKVKSRLTGEVVISPESKKKGLHKVEWLYPSITCRRSVDHIKDRDCSRRESCCFPFHFSLETTTLYRDAFIGSQEERSFRIVFIGYNTKKPRWCSCQLKTYFVL